jgi:hypothetical protein
MVDLISRSGATVSSLNPIGFPPKITSKSAAARLESLDNRTIYLVDCRFDDSIELLRQVKAWFDSKMPSVTTRIVSLSNVYGRDDPTTWEEIRAHGDAAIVGVGHCSTCAPSVAAHAMTLESKYGVPSVAMHTEMFDKVVRSVTRVGGLPDLACVFVPQPVMGKSAADLEAYVYGDDPITGRPVMQEVIEGLIEGQHVQAQPRPDRTTPRLLDPSGEDELQRLFLENRWTDQYPIVIPTEERVAAMLRGTSRGPDEVVGSMQPTQHRGRWQYTVEKVAINAVMAGARPDYLPVILALAASEVSARGSTSSSSSAMAVVNGPIRQEIDMNCGTGALGPYNHANATIGRAYGLLSQNLQGGSVPGETFMGSQGNGFTYNNLTFAENEERSPWEPLHVAKGFKANDSVVNVFSGGRSTTFSLGLREQHWREHVHDMLFGVDIVSAPALLLDPITARQFVERGGFEKKEQLVRFIFEAAQMPAARYWDLQLVQNYIYPRATFGEEPLASRLAAGADELIPMFLEGDINVIVVGGETNGYWQIQGSHYRKSVSIDEWR